MKASALLAQFLEIVNIEENQASLDYGHSALLKEMMMEKSEAFKANFDAYVANLSCPKPAINHIWKDTPS